MTELRIIAIDPHRLDALRAAGNDGHGNEIVAYPAVGWEPTRCCLRIAQPGESIALIAYAPFEEPSPWTEVGPVFIHPDACDGYRPDAGLPAELRTGPRVLRTYRADRTLDYEDITAVESDVDIEPALRDLLSRPEVAEVHVRASMSQCFAYAVRAAE
jgi:hypothetical protein